jgi:hypothetical protein
MPFVNHGTETSSSVSLEMTSFTSRTRAAVESSTSRSPRADYVDTPKPSVPLAARIGRVGEVPKHPGLRSDRVATIDRGGHRPAVAHPDRSFGEADVLRPTAKPVVDDGHPSGIVTRGRSRPSWRRPWRQVQRLTIAGRAAAAVPGSLRDRLAGYLRAVDFCEDKSSPPVRNTTQAFEQAGAPASRADVLDDLRRPNLCGSV